MNFTFRLICKSQPMQADYCSEYLQLLCSCQQLMNPQPILSTLFGRGYASLRMPFIIVFLLHLQALRPMQLRERPLVGYLRWLLLCKHQHELWFQLLRLLLLKRSYTQLSQLLLQFHCILNLSLHLYHLSRLLFQLPIQTLFLQFLLLDFIFLDFFTFEQDLLSFLHPYALLV